jgi:hypothetical protein
LLSADDWGSIGFDVASAVTGTRGIYRRAQARAAAVNTVEEARSAKPPGEWYLKEWPEEQALVRVRSIENGAELSDLYRGNFPQGTGQTIVANALKEIGVPRPNIIRLTNIVEEDTLPKLWDLTPGQAYPVSKLSELGLGRFALRLAPKLGGRIESWDLLRNERGTYSIDLHLTYGE